MMAYEDWSYLVEVEIGTPAQKFMMGLTTFSSDSWVLGKNCWSLPCFWMPLYDSGASATFHQDNRPFLKPVFEIVGGGVTGKVTQDTVKLGNLVVENFKFGEISKIGGNDFVFNKMNGMIGFGYKTDSANITEQDSFLW